MGRAKGLSDSRVMLWYAARNALLPTVSAPCHLARRRPRRLAGHRGGLQLSGPRQHALPGHPRARLSGDPGPAPDHDGGDARRQLHRRPELCAARSAAEAGLSDASSSLQLLHNRKALIGVTILAIIILVAILRAAAHRVQPDAAASAGRTSRRRPTIGSAPRASATTSSPGSLRRPHLACRRLRGGAADHGDRHGRSASSPAISGGVIDEVITFFTNMVLVIPNLPLLLVLAAFIGQASPLVIAIILGFTSWAWGARVTRAETLSIRQRDFVKSAEMLGEPALAHHGLRDLPQPHLDRRHQLHRQRHLRHHHRGDAGVPRPRRPQHRLLGHHALQCAERLGAFGRRLVGPAHARASRSPCSARPRAHQLRDRRDRQSAPAHRQSC